jgi:type IV pilus assembly protein PilB
VLKPPRDNSIASGQARPARGSRPGTSQPRNSALPPRIADAFGKLLTEAKTVSDDSLQSAIRFARYSAIPLHQAVIRLGLVDERTVYATLAAASGLELVDAREVVPTAMALQIVPARVARQHQVLPVSVDDRTMTYLTSTPYDPDAERDLNFTSGRRPVAKLACPSDLRVALQHGYPDNVHIEGLLTQARAHTHSPVEKIQAADERLFTDSAVVELCDTLVVRAVDSGASDLYLDPSDNGLLARIRVGGVLESVLALPPDVARMVVNRFKVMARSDIAVRQRPQDGAFPMRVGGRRVDVRLSTLPTTVGEKIVMRIIDSESELQSLGTLGYDEPFVAGLRGILDRPDGLVLVTGPTGSGKTTLLYAALHHLRSGRSNVVSVEASVERKLPGVNQIAVDARAGATYASVLRSVLRQEPDALMVGEIRDAEVASIVGQAAYRGHLVLSSLHTIDAATAVTRLLDFGLEPFRISESLSAILAQRLVRRLCPACRVVNDNGSAAGQGCAECNFTGWVDRIPVAELLVPTPDIRAVVARSGSAADIRQAMRSAEIPTMRDRAQMLVAAGTTTEQEIVRALGCEGDRSDMSTGARQTVLVADDDPVTRTLVRLLLEHDGYAVVEAATGRIAVELTASKGPELIVMDLNMPQMDGYEAIEAIRRIPAAAKTPIVVVTAQDGAETERKLLALGADDYIVKPFEPTSLSARIKAVFERQRLAA